MLAYVGTWINYFIYNVHLIKKLDKCFTNKFYNPL